MKNPRAAMQKISSSSNTQWPRTHLDFNYVRTISMRRSVDEGRFDAAVEAEGRPDIEVSTI